LGNELN
ncbi:hypothetical protein D039_3428B, partial [Vibrio parahaemolyticus EKP-028]